MEKRVKDTYWRIRAIVSYKKERSKFSHMEDWSSNARFYFLATGVELMKYEAHHKQQAIKSGHINHKSIMRWVSECN